MRTFSFLCYAVFIIGTGLWVGNAYMIPYLEARMGLWGVLLFLPWCMTLGVCGTNLSFILTDATERAVMRNRAK